MSSHYAHQRGYVLEKYIHIFVIMLVGGYYAGAVAVFVPYYAYSSSISGKETDIWMVGVCVYTSVVVYTHILFFSFIRDFNILLCSVMLVVWSILPIICGVLHGVKNLEPTLYLAMYTEIFGDGMYWLATIITVGLMVIPFVVYRMVKDLILFPEFNFA